MLDDPARCLSRMSVSMLRASEPRARSLLPVAVFAAHAFLGARALCLIVAVVVFGGGFLERHEERKQCEKGQKGETNAIIAAAWEPNARKEVTSAKRISWPRFGSD